MRAMVGLMAGVFLVSGTNTPAKAQTGTKRVITLASADRIVAAAEAETVRRGQG